jgi:DNA-binding MarR family transcriptional regulator
MQTQENVLLERLGGTATASASVLNSETSDNFTTADLLDPSGADEAELHEILSDLVVASHRLTRLAARVTGSTESPATWRTLSVLQTEGNMRLGELAAHSRVSQPTMTKIVRNLVETEWIKRIADTDDARAWQIAITKKGELKLADWRDQLASALLPMFTDLSEGQVDSLHDAVEIISSRCALSESTPAATVVTARL